MIRVLFLAGIGRSGSTLIERTLAEVDGVTALGEVMHLWDRGLVRNELCACGRPFQSCPFWLDVGQRAFGGWHNVDPARMADLKGHVDRVSRLPLVASGLPNGVRHDVLEYAGRYRELYRAALEVSDSEVVVDSSKQVSLGWCLARLDDIDLRVVHCVRDSRGVAYSWAKSVQRPEAVTDEHAEMPKYSGSTISTLWTVHNTAIEALRTRVPVLRVRYEDFVRQPHELTTRILRFAGSSAEASHVTSSAVTLGPNHSAAGNPMRFKQGRVELVSDEAWRARQPSGQRRTVTAMTAPMLGLYGYRLTTGTPSGGHA